MQPQIYTHALEISSQMRDNNNTIITKLCTNSKKISKKRTRYRRIDDDIRQKLIDAVLKDGQMLKTAAKSFQINYSSAKSIFHTYRKEGRVNKKMFRERHNKKSDTRKLSFDSTDASSSESHLDSPLLEKPFNLLSQTSFRPFQSPNLAPKPLPIQFPLEPLGNPQFALSQYCQAAPQTPRVIPSLVSLHMNPPQQQMGPFIHSPSTLLAMQTHLEKSYYQLFNAHQTHPRLANFAPCYRI